MVYLHLKGFILILRDNMGSLRTSHIRQAFFPPITCFPSGMSRRKTDNAHHQANRTSRSFPTQRR